MPAPRPTRRVAMVSVHTSPLEQPGTGDAGGMNVYVRELATRLAERDVEVEIFTRATSAAQPPVAEAAPGVLVRHVPAGPFEGLPKQDLPAQLCAFTRDVLRAEAVGAAGRYDVVHTHYWLSGQVGLVARDRWGVPLVHSAHTLARVKNAALADGDAAEPVSRAAGEQAVVDGADRLVANTVDEARALVDLYAADPDHVDVVAPGVDLRTFAPRDQTVARQALGLRPDAVVLTFAGRIQPLKAPDVLLRAAALLVDRRTALRERLTVAVVGGPSGSGLEHPESLADLARDLGVADLVRFVPPVAQADLATWYAASTAVCVPSYNESFGLVALEAQACGTPVVAARVGGLATAVGDGRTGVLVDGHDPADYAEAFARLAEQPQQRDAMGRAAARHAAGFGWRRTADEILAVYEAARAAHQAPRTVAS